MDPVTILLSLAIVAVLAVVIVIAMKTEKKKTAEILSGLTPEQKERLMNAEIIPGGGHCWVQEMLIVSVKDKGGKVGIKALYYNLTIRNNTWQQFCPADFSASKAEFTEKGLGVGTFALVRVDPDKSSVKLV